MNLKERLEGSKLIFVSNFPQSESDIKEGMAQRIYAVDKHFDGLNRIYIQISFLKFWKKRIEPVNRECIQLRVNLLAHFLFIIQLYRKASTIYFHSIINVLPSLLCLFFVQKNKKIILDVHGVVPEEHLFVKKTFMSRLYSFSEAFLFKRLSTAICVTQKMVDFYKMKYGVSKTKYIVYTILPSNLLPINFNLKSNDNKVSIIYSGNVQKWQNIELMIQTIKLNSSRNFHYTILTGETEMMRQLFIDANISLDQVTIKSVLPDELSSYYGQAHYGFILRDDIIVNQVACPTKLVEYLYYGIIPIIKSPDIGDFNLLGYEYLDYKKFSIDLLPRKSSINNDIILSLIDRNQAINLKELCQVNDREFV